MKNSITLKLEFIAQKNNLVHISLDLHHVKMRKNDNDETCGNNISEMR